MPRLLVSRNAMACLLVTVCWFVTGCTVLGGSSPTQIVADPSELMVSLTDLLGEDWNSAGYRVPTRLEDMKGRPSSLIFRIDQEVQHKDNYLAFIDYNIFVYRDERAASDRFSVQARTIYYDFQSQYKWREVETEASALHVDQIRFACKEISPEGSIQDVRCAALMRYGEVIVYMNIWKTRDSVEYLTFEKIYDIFRAVDRVLTSYRSQ
jgi:hypothetical protein